MKTFQANFFKNLLSSDGHQYKCLQNSLEVTGDDAGDALLSAKKHFEQLTHAMNWAHHADFVELEEKDPSLANQAAASETKTGH